MNRTELLSSGSQAALGATVEPRGVHGRTHEANARFPYLGSGSEAGAAALERLRQAGMVDESNLEERGGGGEIYE